jgi:hypothetical protein
MIGLRARTKTLLWRLLERARYRHYAIAKAYHRLLMRRMERRERAAPILVYQMGKVGSRTVRESLRRVGLPSRVLHVHFLTDEGIRREEELHRRTWRQDGRAAHVWRSQHLRRRLDRPPPAGRWHVVTLVRDPIARNLSSFFQTGERELGLDFGQHTSEEKADAHVEELTRLFLERFGGHEAPLTWFDSELKTVFGIDVYAVPFNHARGYQIYENDAARVLLIRLEDLRTCAPAAFRDFLGLESFTLAETNVAEEKDYGRAYRRFVAGVQLPSAYIARMYDSRYARQFYSEGELDAFRRRWEGDLPRRVGSIRSC